MHSSFADFILHSFLRQNCIVAIDSRPAFSGLCFDSFSLLDLCFNHNYNYPSQPKINEDYIGFVFNSFDFNLELEFEVVIFL